MKPLLSSSTCLSCDGCCRFNGEKDHWRAKVGKSEEKIIKENLPSNSDINVKNLVEDGGYLKTRLCHGLFICTFFNPEDYTCGVYQNRPFECQLYPFVLTSVKGKASVSVHLSCPYIQRSKESKEYSDYVVYLKEFFKKSEVKTLLDANPHLFGEYKGSEKELELVFHL